ncbi:hypothetical protein [Methylocystis sp.]|uniref:hypothetical protein n=1 Tax=Methylocystis sp. TaxID=1911079 RepID=UPI0025D68A7D|nr:hypothetical protein [Methylocystis sp.]
MRHFSTTQLATNKKGAAFFAPLDAFDHDAARHDGWVLSDCGFNRDGTQHVEIQKFDNPQGGAPRFAEDNAAWAHVVARARAGSLLHIQALELVDRRERLAIEALNGTC